MQRFLHTSVRVRKTKKIDAGCSSPNTREAREKGGLRTDVPSCVPSETAQQGWRSIQDCIVTRFSDIDELRGGLLEPRLLPLQVAVDEAAQRSRHAFKLDLNPTEACAHGFSVRWLAVAVAVQNAISHRAAAESAALVARLVARRAAQSAGHLPTMDRREGGERGSMHIQL